MLFRYERAKWLCISMSTAMMMQNVVNPTFQPTNKQEESGACSNYPERGGGRRSQRGSSEHCAEVLTVSHCSRK